MKHTARKYKQGAVACLVVVLVALMASCARPPAPTGELVGLELVAQGFTSPVGMAWPDDGSNRLYVIDQLGLIHILDETGSRLATPFLDLSAKIVPLSPTYDERGLLGLAFHPDFGTNGRFFVTYNAPGDGLPEGFDSELRLSEFSASPGSGVADLDSEVILLIIPKPQYNHNGGQLAFGSDGMLYFSVGDGGGGNDEGPGHNPAIGNGQDKTTLLGKVLRIDVNGDGNQGYAIPEDNPFINDDEARPEIWALGLRNPWRFSFDMEGGNRLFLADAGQDLFEEVNIIERGGNYGWRIKEGFSCFNVDDPGDPLDQCAATGPDGDPLIEPILDFPHSNGAGLPTGTVVIGGYVYRGTDLPGLRGDYIFGDFTTVAPLPNGQLYAASENANGTWTQRRLRVRGEPTGGANGYILAFGQDAAGEVYVMTTGNFGPVGSTGRVYRLEAP
jgi:glucose/arabinose dehydrogenase